MKDKFGTIQFPDVVVIKIPVKRQPDKSLRRFRAQIRIGKIRAENTDTAGVAQKIFQAHFSRAPVSGCIAIRMNHKKGFAFFDENSDVRKTLIDEIVFAD